VPGKCLFGGLHVFLQGAPGAPVRGRFRAQQPLPALRVTMGHLTTDVHQQRLIDIEAAEVGKAVLSEHPKPL
jgi:hypothetical protein